MVEIVIDEHTWHFPHIEDGEKKPQRNQPVVIGDDKFNIVNNEERRTTIGYHCWRSKVYAEEEMA